MNEVLVIKIGGSTLEEEDLTIKNIAALHQQGNSMVVVHGGGKEIDQELTESGIVPKKIDGQRVTNSEILKVVVKTLVEINKRLVVKLEAEGVSVFAADPNSEILQGEIENPVLGFVGKVKSIKTEVLSHELMQDHIPVVSPIAKNLQPPFGYLNINADLVAAAITLSIPSSKLILLTDVSGVQGRDDVVIPQLSIGRVQQLMDEGIIAGGMIPKINAGVMAVEAGHRSLICHYSTLVNVLGKNFIGTEIFYHEN